MTTTADLEHSTTPDADPAAVQAFGERAFGDVAATSTVVLAALGDRLGLFTALATHGPATSAELAARTGTVERYVREWANGLIAAEYLERDGDRIVLPAAHVPTLATEYGPMFFGGAYEEFIGALQRYHQVAEAFRHGGGVPSSDLHEDVWHGLERFTAGWHDNLLVQQWIPLLPAVQDRLRAGVRVADVGCGRGRALIRLATAFPACTFVGYDEYPPNIDRARQAAADAGVADRVSFAVADVSTGLPEKFDVITAFDVIHDTVDPEAVLRSVHDALQPDGTFVALDINCADDQAANVGPIAALLYGMSVLYCMTVSLAHDGAGLGTLGLPPGKLRELAARAGFTDVRQAELDDPFNNLYELRRAAA